MHGVCKPPALWHEERFSNKGDPDPQAFFSGVCIFGKSHPWYVGPVQDKPVWFDIKLMLRWGPLGNRSAFVSICNFWTNIYITYWLTGTHNACSSVWSFSLSWCRHLWLFPVYTNGNSSSQYTCKLGLFSPVLVPVVRLVQNKMVAKYVATYKKFKMHRLIYEKKRPFRMAVGHLCVNLMSTAV